MITVDNNSILEFETLLIELGGVYKVNENKSIVNSISGEAIAIPSGKKNLPLYLFYEGMPITEEIALLNPFKENLGYSREREWFYEALQTILGMIVKSIMKKAVSVSVEKATPNYDTFPLISKISQLADITMVDELEKIRPVDFLLIYYNKKNRTAEAQTSLFTEEFQKAHPKIRKKTWNVISVIFKDIFGVEDLPDELYAKHSELLNIPETDAKLHVMIAVAKALSPLARDLLDMDLHSAQLEQHLEVLEGYSKLYEWVSITKTKETDKKDTSSWNSTPVWASSPASSNTFLPMNQPGPAFSPVSNLVPVDSSYGNPFMSAYRGPQSPIDGMFGAGGWR